MITPPLTCDPGRADRVNLPRVLSSHEEATVRCANARPGSNSSTGFQAPVRPKTSGPHATNSILPTVPVFIDRCGAVRHAKLIPSGYNSYRAIGSCVAKEMPPSQRRHAISEARRAEIWDGRVEG